MKTIPFIICIGCVTCACLPVGQADMVELENGVSMEVVIDKQTDKEIICYSETGKITFPRSSLASITPASDAVNGALRKKWKEQKKEMKQQRTKKVVSTMQEKRGTKGLILYKNEWLTEEEYAELKEALRIKREERLKAELERHKEDILEKELKALKEETKEMIIQNKDRRSPYGNALLEEGEWLMKKNQNFAVFFDTDEALPLAQTIITLSDYFFDKIKKDLALPITFYFEKKIEIYLVTDEDTWTGLKEHFTALETDAGFALAHNKELFINALKKEDDIRAVFIHELSHLFLKEHVIKNFSKKHVLPLWLDEGFANFESPLAEYLLPEKDLLSAIHKNFYMKLDAVLTATDYPSTFSERQLFYTEATTLVTYIYERYGRTQLREFIDAVVTEWTDAAARKNLIDEKNVRKMMRLVIEKSFLGNDFAGYSSFEEAWLRFSSE